MATSAPSRRAGRRTLGAWAVVGATTVLAAEGWRSLAAAPGGPWHAMVSQGVVLIGPAVLALVVLALAAERLWPAVARPVGAVGHRQDALYLALYVAVAIPAVTLIGSGAATVLQRLDGGFTLHPFGALPRWALVVVVLVLIDLANWTSHLYNHRIDAFWRFHALHHSQEEMSILTSFRAHPLVHTSFQLTAVPLIVLGTGGAVPASVLIAYVLFSTMPHANVNWGFGPLRYVIVSPAYHRLHHDRDDRRGVNLGTVLVLWDVLAGLAVFPAGRRAGAGAGAGARAGAAVAAAPVATGLAGRPLPVEQEVGARLARTMSRQLWSPIQAAAPTGALDGAGAGALDGAGPAALDGAAVVALDGAAVVARVRVPEMAGASHG
ncbi:MAG TPA: sterol desaturase family protein [Acidimicrobiales bacterium]|jgi:sterol desaturase/sphingolipid hydroxylase (fatty acid hydroxylase superfamily)|nr:sterol desaturase family protein [Acidimicrobiales bacterium]